MNWPTYFSLSISLLLTSGLAAAQQERANTSASMDAMKLQVEHLSTAVAHEELALEASQREIQELHTQIVELQTKLAAANLVPTKTPDEEAQTGLARLQTEVDKLREQEDLHQSEIAVHDQTKIESASKFPVKLTGLILMNAFVNTSGVDVIQSPTLATGGGGTTGLSLRQTVLGVDARGPHMFGGASAADVRVDFFGGLSQTGYTNTGGLARLRTAHAEVAWNETRAFVELDRPIVNPNAPTSLTAIAQPALAWSGNLWNWTPQIGAEHSFPLTGSSRLNIQGALADISDPVTPGLQVMIQPAASLAEQSRWPGSEARVGYARGDRGTGLGLGVGGYFSPHAAGNEFRFDAWAATIDYRIPISSRFGASGSLYRGSALGGLGGGAFKDYVYKGLGESYLFRALDDVGGWTQLKARAGERIEFNAAYGIDEVFAGELRPYLPLQSGPYMNLVRNSTMSTNIIFSPTAYTLFSFEYRRIDSSPAVGQHSVADVVGLAAGYRF